MRPARSPATDPTPGKLARNDQDSSAGYLQIDQGLPGDGHALGVVEYRIVMNGFPVEGRCRRRSAPDFVGILTQRRRCHLLSSRYRVRCVPCYPRTKLCHRIFVEFVLQIQVPLLHVGPNRLVRNRTIATDWTSSGCGYDLVVRSQMKTLVVCTVGLAAVSAIRRSLRCRWCVRRTLRSRLVLQSFHLLRIHAKQFAGRD